ncbi:hypothetical protein SAMN06297280_1495 [Arsukibacterium tuosuense]|uniref:Uncharacterized protein n=1 Tax=Arsukibacterium tuosuense TaxID=1323745 RepID=A0A285INV9_9GAMM|nr:hypothetical protein [Arsukibacterium tuosuense]SNY49662.1 hypothetical protein SAMN06297280_1495 [Arsukibacterium tuosuense]
MAVLKTLARGTVKLLVGLLLLLAGFYLILLAINWQDAKPNAASLHMQSLLQPPPIPAAQNGYQYYLAHNASNELLLTGPLQQLYGQCSEALSCVDALNSQTDLAELVAEQEPLMTFYQQLLQYPQWLEPPPKVQDMSAYQLLLHGQRLFLWQAWLDAQNGNSTQVKTALEADYQFWKTVLANTNSLITKMISVAAIERHFILSTVIISQLPAEQRLAAIPDGWDVAFSDSELGLELALAGEWHYGADITATMRDTAPSDFGSDINTVETVYYLLVQPLILLEDTKNMYATQLVQRNKTTQHSDYPWYSWLRNPVGKMLMATGSVSYESYQQRLLKLEQHRQDALQQVN